MKKFTFAAVAASVLFSAASMQAATLYAVGDAMPHGWDIGPSALISNDGSETTFQGVLYLKANADFKFIAGRDYSAPQWGAEESGVVANAEGVKLVDLAGRDDNKF